MSNVITGLTLTGSILTMIGTAAERRERESQDIGDELANTVLLNQFLEMDSEQLEGFSNSLVTSGDELRYMDLYCSEVSGVEDEKQKALTYLCYLQRECRKASKRKGVQGVLKVLQDNGLKVTIEVEKESPIDLAYCIHSRTKWDWSPLFKVAATSAVLITIYVLGKKIVTTLNQRKREIADLKVEVTQLREENSYLYQFAPGNLGEYAGEVLLP